MNYQEIFVNLVKSELEQLNKDLDYLQKNPREQNDFYKRSALMHTINALSKINMDNPMSNIDIIHDIEDAILTTARTLMIGVDVYNHDSVVRNIEAKLWIQLYAKFVKEVGLDKVGDNIKVILTLITNKIYFKQ